jgi:Mn2+/Fe2+ NRAMP family transporter
VLNGIIAPPLMVLILLIAGNKKIMGKHANSRFSTALGWFITVIMAVAALALLYNVF